MCWIEGKSEACLRTVIFECDLQANFSDEANSVISRCLRQIRTPARNSKHHKKQREVSEGIYN